MPAVRTYGIPRIVEAREIFLFNQGKGRLPIVFSGGIPDPKFQIPATYSTNNEFEQAVIESSPLFGVKVFRYGQHGEQISESTFKVDTTPAALKGKIGAQVVKKAADKSNVYENVETLGQATEVLLELGAKAEDLNGPDAVVAQMIQMKVSFPNLKY